MTQSNLALMISNKVSVFLLMFGVFSCTTPENKVLLTFQVDLSKSLDEVLDPNSIGILGIPPLLSMQERTRMQSTEQDGIYNLSLEIPDSLIGERLVFLYVVDTSRFENLRYGARVVKIPEISDTLPLVHFNEFGDASGDQILLSPPIKVFRTNTPEEKSALEDPFVGITIDGKPMQNLYATIITGVETQSLRDAVDSFINSLTPDQRKNTLFEIESDEWRKWHNIEWYERQGLGLFEMNDDQKQLAFNILKASLSAKGFQKSKNIMAMEGYLKQLVIKEQQISQERIDLLGHDKFYFTIMGIPSESEPWGWQIDGHHLVINYFVLGDQVVMTPTFMGSEPNYIEEGPDAGVRTFYEEEKKGLTLYQSLDVDQKEKATLWDKKEYQFNQSEAFQDNQVIPYQGIKVSFLSVEQKELLIALIEEYVGDIKSEHAEIKMTEVKQHLDDTWFSWVGGDTEDDVFYYRIHSPVILIEFDHHGPTFLWDRNKPHPGPVKWHVHTVVRTPNGNDYGKDLLRQHLERHPH
ncbi:MAG: DUF3500 domain-containing protein [Saprospiraceae bacterium]